MQPHEYSVIGHSRATIGRHLGTMAGIIAAGCALVVTVALDLAKHTGIAGWVPEVVLLPISAAVVYPIGHWAFDVWAWKWRPMLRVLRIPDLNGEWACDGKTMDSDGNVVHTWSATVVISQTWEKIKVYFDTGSSKSASVAAALVKETGRGFLLMYSYRNEPKIGEKELHPHTGYCELTFDEDLNLAEGDYFNNKGRVTFGRMKLIRRKKG